MVKTYEYIKNINILVYILPSNDEYDYSFVYIYTARQMAYMFLECLIDTRCQNA